MARMNVNVTSDIIVYSFNDKTFLVIKRKNEPFQNQWALPGGYVDEGETFLQAAVRELKEETDVDFRPELFNLVGTYDDPNRDPRGRAIGQTFMVWYFGLDLKVTAGDDATEFMWWPYDKPGLAFDHDKMVKDAFTMIGML